MSELSVACALPPVDVTRLARPLGVVVPVSFAGPVWSFCLTGAADAGVVMDADRVARYLLTGLVRALRRAGGGPLAPAAPGTHPPGLPTRLAYRMALGQLEVALVARLDAGGIHIEDGVALTHPPRVAG